MNNYVEGIKNLHKAASLDHSFLRSIYTNILAEAYGDVGFDDKSLYYYQEALQLNNDSSRYFWALANIEVEKGNPEIALELYMNTYNFFGIGFIILQNINLGNFEEAYNYSLRFIESEEDFRQLSNSHRIGHAFWLVGKEVEAKIFFDRQINYCLESMRLDRGCMNY